MNNAGIAELGRVVDTDEALWYRVMTVNLKAPFLVCKCISPGMIETMSGGSIIFIASTASESADADWSAYNASKHGLLGLCKRLAAEGGRDQIRINAIYPERIETELPLFGRIHV